jgi:triphosphatase
MTEFELKFQVPPVRSDAIENALKRGAVERTQLRAQYFDTNDEALARAGLILRLRQEGEQWVQTAKGPGRHGFERLEHNAPVASRSARPDPGLHQGHPVGAALRSALAASADGRLHRVFETDVVRLARTFETSDTSVEVAFDRGQIRAGTQAMPVMELEFELVNGNRAALVELAQRWCEKHGLWLDPLTKSGAGRRLAKGIPGGPPVQADDVRASESAPGSVAEMLDAGLQQVLGNAREIAAGTGGDEHVHQLRIGLRRLRTLLRELRATGLLPSPDLQLDSSLRDLFSVLGEHRDRSTLLPRLQAELAEEGSPAAAWCPPLPDLGATVRSNDFQSAVLQLMAHSQELKLQAASGPAVGARSMRKLVRARLRKLHRRTVRDGRHFEELAEPARHRVRKQVKRLRYLAELTRALFNGRAVDRYVASLKELQDALGAYQDAAAGKALFTARASDDPGAWFVVGWLGAREEGLAAACASACRRMCRKAQPFWE